MVQVGISRYVYSALIFASCASLTGTEFYSHVAIVGAGLAGLTTGCRLYDMGFDLNIYEAKNRVGGRVISIYIGEDESTERVAELGGHNILDAVSSENIRSLIEEFDLETIKSTQPIQLYHLKEGAISDPHSALKKIGFTPASVKARLNLICKHAETMHDVLHELFKDDELLYESFRIRLEDYEGDSVHNLSASCVDSLYKFLIEELYSNPEDEICYEKYLYIKGGNSLLPQRLADKLGDRVVLNKVLKEVARDEDGYILSFADGTYARARVLVLTMPCPVYNDIVFSDEVIPAEKLATIRAIRYGTNSKILVPVKPTDEEINQYTNGRMIALRGGHENVATLYYINGHGNFTQTNLKTIYERDVPTLLMNSELDVFLDEPVMSSDELYASYHGPVGYSWTNDPFAKGSYSYPSAGQEEEFTSLIIVAGEHVKELFAPLNDNTLLFAGEAASTMLKSEGTMEAAVESGERTARLIGKLHTPINEEKIEAEIDGESNDEK